MITAEIIAKIFYRALHDATQSDFLRAICDQVLGDEKMHVQFQAERLAIVRKNREQPMLVVTNYIQRFLFAGTVLVVWMKCKRTLRAGDYTFTSFFSDCWQELNLAMRLMDSRSYQDISAVATASEVLEGD